MSSSVLWRRWRFVATRSSRAFIASPPKKATLIRTGTHPSKEHVPSSGAPLALPVIKYNNADEGIPASVSERKVSLWKKITSVNQTIKALTSKLDGGVENPFYDRKYLSLRQELARLCAGKRITTARPDATVEEWEAASRHLIHHVEVSETLQPSLISACQNIKEKVPKKELYDKFLPHLSLFLDIHKAQLIARDEGLKIGIKSPPEWYPLARSLKRKIVFHSGPTNSGKTYGALKAYNRAKSAAFCGPLRLLAYEVYAKTNALGVPCDLITGEEKRKSVLTPGGRVERLHIMNQASSRAREAISLEEKYSDVPVTQSPLPLDNNGKPIVMTLKRSRDMPVVIYPPAIRAGMVDGVRRTSHVACTVEMFKPEVYYDVVVLDEVQMIGSKDRGYAWANVLMGAYTSELHLCGEPRSEAILRQIAHECGDDFQVKHYQRLSPLSEGRPLSTTPRKMDKNKAVKETKSASTATTGTTGTTTPNTTTSPIPTNTNTTTNTTTTTTTTSVTPTNINVEPPMALAGGPRNAKTSALVSQLVPGDTIIAFGKAALFDLKAQIELQTSFKVALVYGKLPPLTRTSQARLFNDRDNKYDILAASDAIGMGLNLHIGRVILHSATKPPFNHKVGPASVRQVCGRAGRFNTRYSDGQWTAMPPVHKYIKECFDAIIADISTAVVTLPDNCLIDLIDKLPSNIPIDVVLSELQTFANFGTQLYKHEDMLEGVSTAELLRGIRLSPSNFLTILKAPLPKRPTNRTGQIFQEIASCIASHRPYHFSRLLKRFDNPQLRSPKPFHTLDTLAELEEKNVALSLFAWLSFRFPHICEGAEKTLGERYEVASLVQHSLEQVTPEKLAKENAEVIERARRRRLHGKRSSPARSRR